MCRIGPRRRGPGLGQRHWFGPSHKPRDAFSRGNPLRPRRPHDSTRRPVMAKDVERTATSAASCEGERETQTAEEQDPEGLRFQTRDTVRWEANEWSRSQRPSLGSEECAFSIGHGWPQTCQERRLHCASCPCLFLRKIRKSQPECARKKEPQPSPYKDSQATLPVITLHMDVDGGVPSTPKATRLSSRDKTNARAPQQAINVVHLRWCARLAAARTARGSDLALARARPVMKRQVSSDQRPPISHTSTTRRARPCSPVSCAVEPASKWLHQQRRYGAGVAVSPQC